MRTVFRVAVALLLIGAVGAGGLYAAARGVFGEEVARRLRHEAALAQVPGLSRGGEVRIAVDGAELATDFYFPDGPREGLATILLRLPYGKRRYGTVARWVGEFVPRGYAVAVQDMRGRWASTGTFAPYPDAAADGVATLDWIAAQDWSNGKVGTIGCSALGEAQVILAAERHPAHAAAIPMAAGGAIGTAGGRYGFFGFYEGGVPRLSSAFGWFVQEGGKTPGLMGGPEVDVGAALTGLPAIDLVARYRDDPTDYEALLDGLTDPEFHRAAGYVGDDARFGTPALMVDTWYDYGVSDTLTLSALMGESAEEQHVLIGPGTHCDMEGPFWRGRVGDLPVKGTPLDFGGIHAAFMDHHLRGGPAPDLARYTVYVLRADRWLESETWPPEGAERRLLHLDGEALAPAPPDAAQSRSFRADPADPVPSLGGAFCCSGDPDARAGPVDQRPIEGRDDLAIYTSAPLDAPLTLAGPLSATLTVSADVTDADLVARLTEVAPDGTSLLIQEGALRLRYREGYDAPRLLEAGAPVTVTVEMRDVAWEVPAGHRLRLHVAASSFPRLARNLQGGGDPNRETQAVAGRLTLHSGGSHAGHLSLTALP